MVFHTQCREASEVKLVLVWPVASTHVVALLKCVTPVIIPLTVIFPSSPDASIYGAC